MFPVSALPLSRTPRRKTSCSAASFRWWTSCRTFWLRRTLPTVWIPWLLKTRAVSRQRIGVAAGLSGEDRRVSVRSPIWLMGRRRPSVARGQSSRPPSLMFLFLVAHSGQKAIAAKEQWKELKATYRENVEAIKIALTKSLTQMEEAQKKRTQLQEAFEQLQAKKQMAMEKRRAAQKQWQLQQEKRLQHLAEVSAQVRERKIGTQKELEGVFQKLGNLKQQARQERDKLQRHQTFLQLLYTLQGKLLFPEAAAEAENILDDKPQQLARPEEHSIGDIMERDPGVSSKADGLQPALDSNLPWLPGGQQHGERS
ncbi:ZW10 interactor isoform X1 [Cebus imitator]|uniref:ZW10 interactor isoform X1 n=1 Tax=Cebus imitator TaxID=2715852 RepID=UPI00080A017C|nr:ZW10 interactor isoform X1 [Cebus imitator]